MKVLHINYALERGGIETWLANLARRLDTGEYRFALAYHRPGSADMADELRSAGMELFPLPSPRSPWNYLRAYRSLLRCAGPFDAVHSHVNFSGLLMLGAHQEGVPVRIAHSHVSPALMTRGLLAGSYAQLTNRRFLPRMTHGIGVSEAAARTLFGNRWRNNPKVTIEPCGIDLKAYDSMPDPGLKAELGIPPGTPVVAVIGRLSREKNQGFALKIVERLARHLPDVRLLLIGEGDLRAELHHSARALGIDSRVLFLGERRDVPALLHHVVDVLLLPSLTEGSPLTVLEGQAAGVPCVVSAAVPRRSLVTGDLVQVRSLDEGLDAWSEAIGEQLEHNRATDTLGLLRDSPFDLGHNARLLTSYYRTAARQG